MNRYSVSVEGNFVRELEISAESEEQAMAKAKEHVNSEIGFQPEDYVIDLVVVKEA